MKLSSLLYEDNGELSNTDLSDVFLTSEELRVIFTMYLQRAKHSGIFRWLHEIIGNFSTTERNPSPTHIFISELIKPV